jgi:uncharacterized protein with HEPN domain
VTAGDAGRERERLEYIQDSIARIDRYTQGSSATFLGEPMVQDAVLRRLENLADATHGLSAGLKARHPQIPWREVCGFRNIAAHAYENLNLTRVWEIVEDYLPALKAIVDEELGK